MGLHILDDRHERFRVVGVIPLRDLEDIRVPRVYVHLLGHSAVADLPRPHLGIAPVVHIAIELDLCSPGADRPARVVLFARAVEVAHQLTADFVEVVACGPFAFKQEYGDIVDDMGIVPGICVVADEQVDPVASTGSGRHLGGGHEVEGMIREVQVQNANHTSWHSLVSRHNTSSERRVRVPDTVDVSFIPHAAVCDESRNSVTDNSIHCGLSCYNCYEPRETG